MAWRLAKSLETLRSQVNALAPSRSKVSDGTIGDEAHSSRTSDHNPNSARVVCALDLTHDPAHGFNSWTFAEMLRVRRDPRIKYVISKGRIFSATTSPWQWRHYSGSNSHTHHVHVSVASSAKLYDDPKAWDIPGDWNDGSDAPPDPAPRPLLKMGSRGDDVKALQAKLGNLVADGIYGPKTYQAVRMFQKSKGLVADGIAGPYTLEALGL